MVQYNISTLAVIFMMMKLFYKGYNWTWNSRKKVFALNNKGLWTILTDNVTMLGDWPVAVCVSWCLYRPSSSRRSVWRRGRERAGSAWLGLACTGLVSSGIRAPTSNWRGRHFRESCVLTEITRHSVTICSEINRDK